MPKARILNLNSGEMIEVQNSSTDNGAPLWQWEWHKGANQQWEVRPIGNGYYLLQHQ
jgi:hypothetical protein